jgi:hypothetical protein
MKSRFAVSVGMFSLFVLSCTWGYSQQPALPGDEHAVLKKLEGNWDAVIKFGTEQSKGSSTSKMGLGGLWLLTEFKGDAGGAPFEGRGIDGYDLDKKKYVSVWADSMTSSLMTFEGTYDPKTKTMTSTGQGKGPDGKPAKFKTTTAMPDDDHQVFKMFLVGPDDKDIPMMTIEYARKK